MLFHSSTRALVNWARLTGGGWRCRPCLSNWSHRCSIGDKSGLYGGQSSGWTLLFARQTWQILALTCCRVRLCCCKKGLTWVGRISSLYLATVKLPSIITKCGFNPCEIPPHTIIDAPNLCLSLQGNRRLNVLVNSMTRRIRAVTRANGRQTRYWGASSILISKSHGSLQF